MRLLLTLTALALSAPSWSADPDVPPAKSAQELSAPAKIARPVNPKDYYPQDAVRRGESGAPIVQACVDATGTLLRDPVIAETSGFPELDAAAQKVAKDMQYAPGTDNGTPLPESCLKFKIKFVLNAPARMIRPVSPDDYMPMASKRRKEQGSPIVQVCVGPTGKPLREPEIIESSGFPELDAAAVKVAKATRYAAGMANNTPLPESCIKFKIKFVLNSQ